MLALALSSGEDEFGVWDCWFFWQFWLCVASVERGRCIQLVSVNTVVRVQPLWHCCCTSGVLAARSLLCPVAI